MGEPKPDSSADARRGYASPPLAGTERVSDLLFEWEMRRLGPLRRRIAGAWRSSHRIVVSVCVAGVMFALGATAVRQPEPEAVPAGPTIEDRLRDAQRELMARQGELELARLELSRLSTIVEHSSTHRIPADLAAAIYDIALSEGVDPALAFSLVRVESGFTRRAVSSAGAIGFTQVMPATAFWLQPGIKRDDLFERDTNLRLGFRYLRMMIEQYDGDLHLALLAYNRGPARVDNILRAGGDPSNGYSVNVRRGLLRLDASRFRLRSD